MRVVRNAQRERAVSSLRPHGFWPYLGLDRCLVRRRRVGRIRLGIAVIRKRDVVAVIRAHCAGGSGTRYRAGTTQWHALACSGAACRHLVQRERTLVGRDTRCVRAPGRRGCEGLCWLVCCWLERVGCLSSWWRLCRVQLCSDSSGLLPHRALPCFVLSKRLTG